MDWPEATAGLFDAVALCSPALLLFEVAVVPVTCEEPLLCGAAVDVLEAAGPREAAAAIGVGVVEGGREIGRVVSVSLEEPGTKGALCRVDFDCTEFEGKGFRRSLAGST